MVCQGKRKAEDWNKLELMYLWSWFCFLFVYSFVSETFTSHAVKISLKSLIVIHTVVLESWIPETIALKIFIESWDAWLTDRPNQWINWTERWIDGWMMARLTDWLTDRSTDWLTVTDWLNGRLTDQSTDWPTEWLADWFADRSTDSLSVWLIY